MTPLMELIARRAVQYVAARQKMRAAGFSANAEESERLLGEVENLVNRLEYPQRNEIVKDRRLAG